MGGGFCYCDHLILDSVKDLLEVDTGAESPASNSAKDFGRWIGTGREGETRVRVGLKVGSGEGLRVRVRMKGRDRLTGSSPA
jgi:hypothetical protein